MMIPLRAGYKQRKTEGRVGHGNENKRARAFIDVQTEGKRLGCGPTPEPQEKLSPNKAKNKSGCWIRGCQVARKWTRIC